MPDLLQAGPLLVESGKGVSGLDASKVSARTFLLWDGGSRWLMARSAPCSLAGLAKILSESKPAGWPVKSALNLDGGPSFVRPIWNNPVRNFLVLRPIQP
ncbi:MAG: hypothetical protein CFE26_27105 [Verrucomicrobiales bacterium VVV1]|nr:MAG: hypothetical protein CFE26_27105 [Verrucomicrobiales bacterium VVV1]